MQTWLFSEDRFVSLLWGRRRHHLSSGGLLVPLRPWSSPSPPTPTCRGPSAWWPRASWWASDTDSHRRISQRSVSLIVFFILWESSHGQKGPSRPRRTETSRLIKTDNGMSARIWYTYSVSLIHPHFLKSESLFLHSGQTRGPRRLNADIIVARVNGTDIGSMAAATKAHQKTVTGWQRCCCCSWRKKTSEEVR